MDHHRFHAKPLLQTRQRAGFLYLSIVLLNIMYCILYHIEYNTKFIIRYNMR